MEAKKIRNSVFLYFLLQTLLFEHQTLSPFLVSKIYLLGFSVDSPPHFVIKKVKIRGADGHFSFARVYPFPL